MDDSLDTWFKREIVVHEEALTRYLRRCWRRDLQEVHDLRQETYIRVYEAARQARPVNARSFLFTTAKYLMTDRARHQRVVTIDTVADLDSLDLMVDDLTPERRNSDRQELRLLAQAFDSLPPKCRQIVWLRKVERLPQKEIASRLGIAQKTIEGHLRKGMKRLADALFGTESLERPAARQHAYCEPQHETPQSD